MTDLFIVLSIGAIGVTVLLWVWDWIERNYRRASDTRSTER